MKTDERGYFDALTERVLGAVFEVSNTIARGWGRGVLCRYSRRRRAGRGVEMRPASLQRTHRAVSQLFASLGPDAVSARQFPETQG